MKTVHHETAVFSFLVLTACCGTSLLSSRVTADDAAPPVMLLQQSPASADASAVNVGYSIMRLPDGRFAFYDRHHPKSEPLVLADRTGTQHSLSPGLPQSVVDSKVIMDSGVLSNQQVVLTTDSDVFGVRVQREELSADAAANVGLRCYLNVWMQRVGPKQPIDSKLIWRGYNGSQMEYQQLASGRLLVPFGSMQPHTDPAPPTGRHRTVIQYSDDGGTTWQESESQLVSPCYTNFNGLNEGACEPAVEQLRDGRLWMLMRTQAGFLYESTSSDNGTTWQAAQASRFSTSTGPPNIMRHRNGWLIVTWNNCEMPPRVNGDGVYGGRDALHIAASDDDGRTWFGFREIYLDHRRNDNPAKSGDRGTAYPLGAFTDDGRIVILAGQGSGGRNPILVNPEWIRQTSAHCDFSNGLQDLSVYKHHGPANRWWRGRTVGCELLPNPAVADSQCLHVRKPDELPADGATWNFPNAWSGELKTRVMLNTGGAGGKLCLNDRFFDPTNDYGEQFANVTLPLGADRILDTAVTQNEWHEIVLKWDLSVAECSVLLDGVPIGTLPLQHPTLNGLSYLRFRSAATEIDAAGFLVDSVDVTITNPAAPPCSGPDKAAQERHYVQHVVPTWSAVAE
ncbi:MAG: sialidase family protein [Planctomycetaceae bacterium]